MPLDLLAADCVTRLGCEVVREIIPWAPFPWLTIASSTWLEVKSLPMTPVYNTRTHTHTPLLMIYEKQRVLESCHCGFGGDSIAVPLFETLTVAFF